MASVNDELQRQIILHAIHSERFGRGLSEQVVQLLDDASDDLMGELAKRLERIKAKGVDRGPATTARLQDLTDYIQGVNDQVYRSKIGPAYRDAFNPLTAQEAAFHADMLRGAITVDFPVSLPPASVLKSIVETSPIDGHLLQSHLEAMSANRTARISQIIQTDLVSGVTIDQMTAKIRGTNANNFEDGTLEISRKSARNIAITGTATVTNNARLAVYQENPKLVSKVRWISTLDSRTTPICQQRDGQIYPIDKPHPVPPAHIRCRSVLLPVTVSWKDLGIDKDETTAPGRSAMDGHVAAETTYEGWLRSQSQAVQDDVLGKARADVFRSGKGDFQKDFFRDDGAYRSVEELKQRLDAAKAPSPPKPEAKAPTPAPRPEPAPAPAPVQKPKAPEPEILKSPIDPTVNDATVQVEPRLVVQKRMGATMKENAADARYSPTREFADRKEADFGSASFSTAFTNEAVSTISALLPELDKLTDAFGIPRVRGFKSLSGGKAVANMGDGVMGVNPPYFNAFAASVGEGASVASAEAKLAELATSVKEAAEKAQGLRDQIDAVSKAGGAGHDIDALWEQWSPIFKDYRSKNEKLWAEKKKARVATKPHVASDWKPGDDPAKRPHTVDNYFEGIDRARAVMYHETAHQVHQMYGRLGPRRQFGAPPLEKDVIAQAYQKLSRPDLDKVASKYALSNRFEWFAENFSAYFMGRLDLVSPSAKELIERLLNDAKK